VKPSAPDHPEATYRLYSVLGASLISQPIGIYSITLTIRPPDVPGARLILLDWNVTTLADARLDEWIARIYQTHAHFAKLCKLLDRDMGLYTELTGLGPSFFDVSVAAGHIEGLDTHRIPESLAELDLLELGTAAARFLPSGQVHIVQPARQKKVAFRGTNESQRVYATRRARGQTRSTSPTGARPDGQRPAEGAEAPGAR
jgi:hypothetical protein